MNSLAGHAMTKLIALLWAVALAAQAAAPLKVAGADSQDPFLWLEDIEGERALSWVRDRNDKSLKTLAADSLRI